jgi:elongation factor G
MKIEPYFEGMPEPAGVSIRNKEVFDLSWGGKMIFYNCIVGGVIDARFIPSIQKGVMEKMQEGPLTGILCARRARHYLRRQDASCRLQRH